MQPTDPIAAELWNTKRVSGLECRTHRTLMESGGVIVSIDERYRYVLWRLWQKHLGVATFVMLNPSTADEKKPDPTVTKCVGFAQRWGLGGILVVNLFGLRSPHPSVLEHAQDPVGPHNAYFVSKVLDTSWTKRCVLAWGNEGSLNARDEAFLVVNAHREMYGLKPPGKPCLTREGNPRHPSRIGYESELVPVVWDGALKERGEG